VTLSVDSGCIDDRVKKSDSAKKRETIFAMQASDKTKMESLPGLTSHNKRSLSVAGNN